jgi:TolB-like protein/DNA-binding winged helix-turn-helix (wHTH) protein/Tfp pilus assembly protein PilF
MSRPGAKYSFGPFQMDVGECLLTRGSEPVPLTAKAFAVLSVLLERPGHLVEKQTLLARVWGDAFVEEAVLSVNVAAIRRALADNGHQYIETVPKHGYRFTAPVEVLAPADAESSPALGERLPFFGAASVARSRRWQWIVALAALLLITVAILASRHSTSDPNPSQARRMLAVLPLDNLTGDPAQDYLSDGLTEELITELGKLQPDRLGVIARTSVVNYKGAHDDIRRIGRELGVDYILEGSVRRDRERMRVTAQLIRVDDQTHVWAESYDRKFSDLLAVEAELGRAITREIKLNFDHGKQTQLSDSMAVNPQAHEAYLLGRLHLRKMTNEGAEKAIAYFQQALAYQPRYALAYTGIGNAYIQLNRSGHGALEQMPKVKEAAQNALRIDPNLAEAHALLGTAALLFDRDWPVAEREFQLAIRLNPNFADAHIGYAALLGAFGRREEMRRELRLAESLDPMSPAVHGEELHMWFSAREYETALHEAQRWRELEPSSQVAYSTMAMAYSYSGQHVPAMAAARKYLELSNSLLARVNWVEIYARAGRMAEARQAMRQIATQLPQSYVCGYNVAAAYAALGEKDKAFESLERAFLQRSD